MKALVDTKKRAANKRGVNMFSFCAQRFKRIAVLMVLAITLSLVPNPVRSAEVLPNNRVVVQKFIKLYKWYETYVRKGEVSQDKWPRLFQILLER